MVRTFFLLACLAFCQAQITSVRSIPGRLNSVQAKPFTAVHGMMPNNLPLRPYSALHTAAAVHGPVTAQPVTARPAYGPVVHSYPKSVNSPFGSVVHGPPLSAPGPVRQVFSPGPNVAGPVYVGRRIPSRFPTGGIFGFPAVSTQPQKVLVQEAGECCANEYFAACNACKQGISPSEFCAKEENYKFIGCNLDLPADSGLPTGFVESLNTLVNKETAEEKFQCCENPGYASCAACLANMTLSAFCKIKENRFMFGCEAKRDGSCTNGVASKDGTVCCDPYSCDGECGGVGCRWRLGGPAHCCASEIRQVAPSCWDSAPPCRLSDVSDEVEMGHRTQEFDNVLSGPGFMAKGVDRQNVPKPDESVYLGHSDFGTLDDGTIIVGDRGCGYLFHCTDCAKAIAGCTWDSKQRKCLPYSGESDCSADIYSSFGR